MKDDQGQSPLDIVLDELDDLGDDSDNYVDVALYLMSHGCACADEAKAMLLCVACLYGMLGVVKELVEQFKVDPKSECDDLYLSTKSNVQVKKPGEDTYTMAVCRWITC